MPNIKETNEPDSFKHERGVKNPFSKTVTKQSERLRTAVWGMRQRKVKTFNITKQVKVEKMRYRF